MVVQVHEVTISSRSRNLSFVWSTLFSGSPLQNCVDDFIPDDRGGIATIEKQMKEHGRVTSGGAYSGCRLWVGDYVVIEGLDEDGYPVFPFLSDIRHIVEGLRYRDEYTPAGEKTHTCFAVHKDWKQELSNGAA